MPRHRPEVGAGVADADLSDRTALVTGSTSGIGRATALALGRLGATVLVHGRDREEGRAVVDALDGDDHAFHRADFADLDAVRDLADSAADRGVDVLVNNAGGYFREGRLTEAGVEYTFHVNHLAPYLLTRRLAPHLPADGRVVVVASEAHRDGRMAFDALRSVDDYSAWAAYTRSKLANVLFTYELADRLDGPPANCCHPGVVPGSGFLRELPGPLRAGAALLDRLPGPLSGPVETPAEAAETPVYLAVDPDLSATGEYFDDCEPRRSSAASYDERTRERLWTLSAEILGVDPALPDRNDQ